MTARKEVEVEIIDQAALDQTNLEIAGCDICAQGGYVAITRPIDRGRGDKQILIVGQAPGYTEGTRQVAFGGPAGRKLMQWFATIGLSEAQVRTYTYMSAITKCYPGRAPGGGGDRNPSPIERANCRPYLLREILAIKPKVVILIGSTAIKEVYGDKTKLEEIIGVTKTMTLGELYVRLQARLVSARRQEMPLLPEFTNVDWEQPVYVFHLPHPSGASTWLNSEANKTLLQNSLTQLGKHLTQPG